MDKIKDNVIDLASNISEAVIDSFLEDGLWKDIPLIRTGITIAKLSTNLSDKILLNKIKKFIENLSTAKQSDIDSLKEKINKDKFKNDIGIKLINIIDKTDEYIKIEWTAKVFLDYLDRKIDKNFFFRIITIINNAFVQDILELKKFRRKNEILSNNKLIESYVLHQLFSNGLLDNAGLDFGSLTLDSDNGTIYILNQFGKYILKKLL